jgi:hypothetical protein
MKIKDDRLDYEAKVEQTFDREKKLIEEVNILKD